VTPLVLGSAGSSDVEYAKRLCFAFGDEAHVVLCPPEEELFRILHTVIYHCESFEPNVVRASALSWILAQSALSCGFRVALCGEGADELFGGYPEFYNGTLGFEATRRRFVQDLYRTKLQRIDRMNMAATIEVRVLFLSRYLANLVLSQTNPEFYIRKENDGIETKVALRRAMRDVLPSEIVHRPKIVMNEGVGYGR
jgi:asparagine synthase (glutamine-hydrolysing)